MRTMNNTFALIFAGIFAAVSAQAGTNWFDADSVFLIPMAEHAPVIDGIMDMDVYGNVMNAPDTVLMDNSTVLPDDWYDFYVSHRMVWYEDMLFIYMEVKDYELFSSEPIWHHDHIEIMFDGNNSDGETNYDGVDDIQLGWSYDEAIVNNGIDVEYGRGPDWGFDANLIDWAMTVSDTGYTLEAAFPYEVLDIDVETDFGFETMITDNDGVDTDLTRYRWHYSGGGSHYRTINHGTCRLIESRVVNDILDVNRIKTAPVIDGKIDDIWYSIPTVSMNTYVTENTHNVLPPEDWWDLNMNFKVAWDENNFYAYIVVTDETLVNNLENAWENDSVELYFDGGNEKSGTFDENDSQTIWIYNSETIPDNFPGSDHSWATLENGYAFEVQIPFSEIKGIESPSAGHIFGFEIRVNDNDGDPKRPTETMASWWNNDNHAYKNSALFGTAKLVSEEPDLVGKEASSTPLKFALYQNYPNPFNPTTTISYQLPENKHVNLTIYNLKGQEVVKLVDEYQNAGNHSLKWQADNHQPSGVYIYKLQTSDFVATKKLIIIK